MVKLQDFVMPALPFDVQTQTLIGSVYIFGEGKDYDVLVLLPKGVSLYNTHDKLKGSGYYVEETYNLDDNSWFSARKGDMNLLVNTCTDHFYAMASAAAVCKALAQVGKLDPSDRDTRVLVHRVLFGDIDPDDKL